MGPVASWVYGYKARIIARSASAKQARNTASMRSSVRGFRGAGGAAETPSFFLRLVLPMVFEVFPVPREQLDARYDVFRFLHREN